MRRKVDTAGELSQLLANAVGCGHTLHQAAAEIVGQKGVLEFASGINNTPHPNAANALYENEISGILQPLDGVTKGATFKREPSGHWFVSLVTEQQAAPRTERPVRSHVAWMLV